MARSLGAVNRVVPALSDALRYATRGRHERLHEWMARADPFASRERYRRYLRVQHAFLDCAAAYTARRSMQYCSSRWFGGAWPSTATLPIWVPA